jgi:hypothetical protein
MESWEKGDSRSPVGEGAGLDRRRGHVYHAAMLDRCALSVLAPDEVATMMD